MSISKLVFFFFFFKSYVRCFKVQEMTCILMIWPKENTPPHPRKHPNPQVPLVQDQPHISPIAQPNPTNILVHTKEAERQEGSMKERRTLSDICETIKLDKRNV